MRLLIGTDDGVHAARWIPGERSARVKTSDLAGDGVATVVEVDGVAYAAGRTKGVYRTDDRGDSWVRASTPPAGRALTALVPAPAQPEVLYAGTEPAGLFASHDAGRSWTCLASFDELGRSEEWRGYGSRDPHVEHLVLDPREGRRMYAAVEIGGAYRSDDGGRNWRSINAGLYDDLHALAVDPAGSTRLLAATGGGLYRSTDRGSSWSAVEGEPGDAYCTALMARRNPDGDGSWAFVATASGPPGSWSQSERGADARLLLSRDGGASWEEVEVRTTYSRAGLSAFAADPQRPEALFVGTTAGEVYYGGPGTVGWSRVLGGLPAVRSMAVV